MVGDHQLFENSSASTRLEYVSSIFRGENGNRRRWKSSVYNALRYISKLGQLSRYRDQASGWTANVSGFGPWQEYEIILYSIASNPALGVTSILCNVYQKLFLLV
jgi:hypothetical protein